MLLDINLLFELHAIPHLHEFVGIAGIAVATAEFTTAVGIDGPGEGHLPAAHAAVQKRLGRKRKVFDVVPFAQRRAFRGEPGNADERVLGFGGILEDRKQCGGLHGWIRLLFAIIGRSESRRQEA